jgi:hypothetical protein
VSSAGPIRPGTPLRRLPHVLREALADRALVRLSLGEVVSIPDPAHVTVKIADPLEDEDALDVVVPKLSSYSPTVGEPCYLLVSGYWTLAIGTVKEV